MFPLCFCWAERRNPVFSWICCVSVMFPERKCRATFLSHFSSRISAVVCFRYVSSHGNESCYAICAPHVIGRSGGPYKKKLWPRSYWKCIFEHEVYKPFPKTLTSERASKSDTIRRNMYQRGIVTPPHQLNSKTNDLVLLLKTIWRYWNFSLSPVATDGMDGNGMCSKNPQEIYYG